jgi:FtsH-binding integral membrane protein
VINSAIGVIVFTGLTAHDTQVIKSYYTELDSGDTSEKKAIIGAFSTLSGFRKSVFVYIEVLGE